MNDTWGAGTRSLPNSFDVHLNQVAGAYGWPVLPHGAGAYYNLTGRYINAQPTRARGSTYGEFIPGSIAGINGELLAGAVNYQNNSALNYDVFMANYGTASSFGQALLGTALAGSFGSFEISFGSGSGIQLAPTDFIGIYVKDPFAPPGTAPPQLLIEGTLYFSLS